LSQEHGNARYTMAKRTHVLRTHYATQQSLTLNEPDIQNNCSICLPFTRTTAFSLPCHWSMDLLMMTQDSPSTLSLRSSRLETGMRYTAYTLCYTELPRQHSRPDLSPGCWVAIQTFRLNSSRYGTLQELDSWLSSMRQRAVLLKHEMIVGLLTNLREKTSLQQSFAVVTCICLGFFVVYCR